MKLRIRYTETWKQVLGIIIIPLLYMGVLMAVLFSFDLGKLSEEMEFALIMGGVILMMAASVFTILRVIMEGGSAYFDEAGLHIRLSRHNFLYPSKVIDIPFGNLADAAINEEPGKGSFISLKTRNPAKSILIFPEAYKDSPEFNNFWIGFNFEIQKMNHVAQENWGMIKNKGFYDNIWFKGIAWVTILAIIGLSLFKIANPEAIAGWKLLMLYSYGLPFLWVVFKPK